MERHIKLGDWNLLRIIRYSDYGLYLDGGRDGRILLPNRYVTPDMQRGQEINAFIYLDQEERPVATTETPLAKVGDFAYLECVWVNEYGAFLDWGLMKNLFCPFHEQKMKMEIGKRYIVYIYIDEESYRIVASAKVDKFINHRTPEYEKGQKVTGLVRQKTEVGFKVIVDNQWNGMVYDNEIYRHVTTGDHIDCYVKEVRFDGKIDLSLQPIGHQHTEEFAEVLLRYLEEHDGICQLGDKSDAEDIKNTFEVSKKAFKRAIGDLYKRRLITVEPMCIKLI